MRTRNGFMEEGYETSATVSLLEVVHIGIRGGGPCAPCWSSIVYCVLGGSVCVLRVGVRLAKVTLL